MHWHRPKHTVLLALRPSPSVTTVALNFYNMINATHTTTKHNNYHMAENTHIPRRPCFGDHGDKDAIFIQSTRYPTRGQKATQCIKSTAMIMMPLVYVGRGCSKHVSQIPWANPGSLSTWQLHGGSFQSLITYPSIHCKNKQEGGGRTKMREEKHVKIFMPILSLSPSPKHEHL